MTRLNGIFNGKIFGSPANGFNAKEQKARSNKSETNTSGSSPTLSRSKSAPSGPMIGDKQGDQPHGLTFGSKFIGRPAKDGKARAHHSTEVPDPIKEEKAGSSKPEPKTPGSSPTLSRSNSASTSSMDMYTLGNRLQGIEIGNTFIGRPANYVLAANPPAAPLIPSVPKKREAIGALGTTATIGLGLLAAGTAAAIIVPTILGSGNSSNGEGAPQS